MPASELPSYDDAQAAVVAGESSSAADEILPPATLHVADRFIHSSDPQAPALYELSHSVGFLKDSDQKVVMRRLEHSVRQQRGVPTVTSRQRDLFDLTHRTLVEAPTYPYQAEAQTRSALSSLGMETFRPPGKLLSLAARGYRVHRASRGSDRRLVSRQVLFQALPTGAGGENEVKWEWTDEQGRMLAREVERDDLRSLVVTQEMGVQMRDALAAAWIMRMWWDRADQSSTSRLLRTARRSVMTTDGGDKTQKKYHIFRGSLR